MIDVFVRDARRHARRGRAARHAAARAAAVGDARRRVRLLHLEPGPVDGHRALPGRRSRGSGLRPAQPEAGRQRRPHPARRVGAAREAALDRRRADPGADAVVGGATATTSCARSPAQLRDAIKQVPDVSEVTLIGGRPRQLRVDLDPARLAAYGLDPLAVRRRCTRANAAQRPPPGRSPAAARRSVEAGDRLHDAPTTSARVVVAARGGRAGAPPRRRRGRRRRRRARRATSPSSRRAAGAAPAVTLAVAKRKGTNAIDVAHRRDAEARDAARARSCPHDVRHDGHARLRRDRGREDQRAAVPHAHRRALGVGADLARARAGARPRSC